MNRTAYRAKNRKKNRNNKSNLYLLGGRCITSSLVGTKGVVEALEPVWNNHWSYCPGGEVFDDRGFWGDALSIIPSLKVLYCGEVSDLPWGRVHQYVRVYALETPKGVYAVKPV